MTAPAAVRDHQVTDPQADRATAAWTWASRSCRAPSRDFRDLDAALGLHDQPHHEMPCSSPVLDRL